ncbi:MAG TPA: nitroreductase family protein [Bacteroidales bacterium]|nr:nitroreductase family protein [Bacteroidales bacterium]
MSLTLFSCTGSKAPEQQQPSALDVIATRVSVRQFTGEKISAEQIDTLLRSAMAAPTAVNKQPWAFVVVDDQAVLDSLSQAVKSSRIENGASHAIVVCGDMSKALEGEAQGYWVEDTSAATENLLLAAHAMGLGALWVGVYPISERVAAVKHIINAPEHITPMCIITLGYPNEQPEIKDKYKPENIHHNAW